MRKTITQRELRNRTGKNIRALDGGPVGEIRPLPRRQFVPAADVVAAFTSGPRLDAGRFRRDLDELIDEDPRPRG
ncbi:MAG TPA: hypothetical protein VFS78_06225 [Vicinamibacteria bacterium]|nr:hypothetical protein [Vicinamibacteria bacterium]